MKTISNVINALLLFALACFAVLPSALAVIRDGMAATQ